MAKAKKTPKKTIRKQIEQQLITTFNHLKEEVSPKRFNRSIRKASKILSEGIRPLRAKSKSKKTTPRVKTTKETIVAE